MDKVTFAVCGMGNRGGVYAGQQLNFPDQMLVTAMADPKPERLEAANKWYYTGTPIRPAVRIADGD